MGVLAIKQRVLPGGYSGWEKMTENISNCLVAIKRNDHRQPTERDPTLSISFQLFIDIYANV